MDHTPLIIGALFGFGAGWMSCYYIFRLPKLHAARKAAKTKRINKIKKYVKQRVASKLLNHTIGSAIVYYKKFSPTMFEGVTDEDLIQLTTEMAQEDANETENIQS